MDFEKITLLKDAGVSLAELDMNTKRNYYGCDGERMVTIANSRWETGRVIRVTNIARGVRCENVVSSDDLAFWLTKYEVKTDSIHWWYEDVDFLYDSELSKRNDEIDKKNKREKLVYFILNPVADLVKIGISEDPAVRLVALQANTPHRLSLLGVVPGGAEKEKELHKQFANLRVRGEWFSFDTELKEFINGLFALVVESAS